MKKIFTIVFSMTILMIISGCGFNAQRTNVVTAHEIHQLKKSISVNETKKVLGDPNDENHNKKKLIKELQDYRFIKNILPTELQSDVNRLTGNDQLTDVERKLENAKSASVLSYSLDKKDNSTIMFVYADNKLINIVTVKDE